MRLVRPVPVRRWCAAAIAAALVVAPTAATASPSGPAQERPASHDGTSDRLAIRAADGGVLAAVGDSSDLTGALDEVKAAVEAEVAKLDAARKALDEAVDELVDADVAVSETERRIEELTARSDEVVVDAFISPPSERAIDVLATATPNDVTVKQAVLNLEAEDLAATLAELDEARGELEAKQADQREALSRATAARAEADAALADVEAAVSQQSWFVLAVTEGLDPNSAQARALAAANPEWAALLAASRDDLVAKLDEIRKTREYEAALQALREAQRREAERREAERRAAEAAAQAAQNPGPSAPSQPASPGSIVCPVQGPVNFTDTWGAARSGGRAHMGVDMLAAMGTPTVAPVSGQVEHRGSSLGGLSWYVYGDDGNTYYGTHLSGYANQGVGWVAAGTVIGYVGDSGNAAGTPHLHFEYHPGGGSPVNPYPLAAGAC
jgi:murein DD-endopeptidase MepM/ murein hydrolase activator NlpD